MNSRPTLYERVALPLSYSGMLLSASLILFYVTFDPGRELFCVVFFEDIPSQAGNDVAVCWW